jgi:hypothetical protein
MENNLLIAYFTTEYCAFIKATGAYVYEDDYGNNQKQTDQAFCAERFAALEKRFQETPNSPQCASAKLDPQP